MDDAPVDSVENPEDDPGWPIGFLLFVGLGALYLIVRFVQLGVRFFEWLA